MALPVFDPTRPDAYEITYGGEMNEPIRYQTVANVGGDAVVVQYDPQGRVVSAFGQPFSQDGKQYVRDYDAQGNVINVREYNKPSIWNDLGQPALFLGATALGANLLGPLVNSAFGAGTAAGSGGLGPVDLAIAAGEGIVPVTAAQTATTGLTTAQLGALGSGIGLSGLGAAGAAGAAAGASGGATTAGGTGLLTNVLTNPATLTNLAKLALTAGAANAMTGGGGGGSTGPGSIPTQGLPTNSPEYFNQVQGFLNQYLPGQMPTQSQYLSSWYNNTPGSYMPSATAPSSGGGMMSPSMPSPSQNALSPQRADVVKTGGGKPRRSQGQPSFSTATSSFPDSVPVFQESPTPSKSTMPATLGMRDLIELSGLSITDPVALQRAQAALYGNIGANLDTRDWEAILASPNPLDAAEKALVSMYSDPAYRAANTAYGVSQGYQPGQEYLTYAQMASRIGANYIPTAEEATAIRPYLADPSGNYQRAEVLGPAQVLANAGYDVPVGYAPFLENPPTAVPYTNLSANSSAADIANAYANFTAQAGGDSPTNQQAAIDYLTKLGVDPSRIGEAYSLFKA